MGDIVESSVELRDILVNASDDENNTRLSLLVWKTEDELWVALAGLFYNEYDGDEDVSEAMQKLEKFYALSARDLSRKIVDWIEQTHDTSLDDILLVLAKMIDMDTDDFGNLKLKEAFTAWLEGHEEDTDDLPESDWLMLSDGKIGWVFGGELAADTIGNYGELVEFVAENDGKVWTADEEEEDEE